MNSLQFASLNVRGIGEVNKRKEMYNFFREQKLDVIAIQETHSTEGMEKDWAAQWGNKVYFSNGTSNKGGVMVLINNEDVETEKLYADNEGRILMIKINYRNLALLLVNIYAPNQDDPQFFVQMFEEIVKTEIAEVVLMGDYNMVMDPKLDRIDAKRYSPQSFKVIENIAEEMDLLDIWRIKNPEARTYSWIRKKSPHRYNTASALSGSRIDFALVSASVANCCVEVGYGYGYKTDHSLFKLKLACTAEQRGPGYWKFNTKLLHDVDFVSKVNMIVTNANEKYSRTTPDNKWSCCKNEITQYAKKRSKEIAKYKREKFEMLLHRVQQIQIKLQNDQRQEIQLANYQKQIEQLIEEQTQSAIFRSKVKFVNQYERSSKFFFSLEKSKYKKKTMSRLVKDNGQVVTDPKGILDEQYKFYEKLYKRDDSVKFKLYNEKGNKLKAQDYDIMESNITYEEMTNAVKQLKKQVTPGPDGWNSEIYQFFWSKIGRMVHEAIAYAKEQGQMHLEARRGVILLIPKKNKNPEKLKAWRPLTMLSTCYKILAKVLALRMKTVLPYLIADTQAGFMENRQISGVLRTTIDISKYGKKLKGYLLSIDFEKCFDKIAYEGIKGSLSYLGFGPQFTQWVNLLLHNFESTTVNNGYLSDHIKIERSCHQGCPVAPLLYLCCGEVMSREIKQNENIHGITMQNLENIIAQFADDTQLFLDSKRSVEEVVKTLSTLEANIGLQVNYEKSSIHTIGTSKRFECTKPLVWDPGGLNVLGIEIKQDDDATYEQVIAKTEQILESWTHRDLTLLGKVMIVNVLTSSLFVYPMQVLGSPSDVIYKKYDALIHKYIWKNKRAKIPMNTLKANKELAGQNLVDLRNKNNALKIAWLFRNEEFARNQIQNIVPQSLGDKFWECNLSQNDLDKFLENKEINPFWTEVVQHWFQLTRDRNESNPTEQPAPMQILWYNSRIKRAGCTMYNEKAVKAGLLIVQNLLHGNGQFKTWNEIQTEFGNCLTWLEYCGLCAAIPRSWKLRNDQYTENESLYEKIQKQQKKVRYIYSLLTETRNSIMYAKDKMSKIFQVNTEETKSAILGINKTTNITKYRDFQYRHMMGTTYANNKLFYWNKVSSQRCEYCDHQYQDIKHLFYECTKVKQLWFNLEKVVQERFKVEPGILQFAGKHIMLGNVHPKYGHVINLLVLVTKQMIYAYKCRSIGEQLTVHCVIKKFNELQRIEKYTAISNGNEHKHLEKWKMYKEN